MNLSNEFRCFESFSDELWEEVTQMVKRLYLAVNIYLEFVIIINYGSYGLYLFCNYILFEFLFTLPINLDW